MDIQEVQMPQEIRIFLESLLSEAKIDNPDPVLKEMMLNDLFERLQTRLIQLLVEHLDEKELEEYERLSAENPVEAFNFVYSKKSNIHELIIKAMEEFRQTFLN